ncbi:MAG: PQQ-binding-like beta-propeller repeat protein [Planctomycetota bacterium]
MRNQAVLFLLAVALMPVMSLADTWPQFRGPRGDGVAVDEHPPTQFGANDAAWRTEIPGRGWSSPVVADGLIYLTTAIEVMPSEDEREELLAKAGVERKKYKQTQLAKQIELRWMAIEMDSGNVVFDQELVAIDSPDAIHTVNSYASPTPVIDGERLYCHFGTYGTFCIDRKSGKRIWKRRFPLSHSVGPGSSPFIHDDMLVLIQDGTEQRYVVALDKISGETVWKTDRPPMDAPKGDLKKAFCTPISITDSLGREQLICLASHYMIAYDPQTGHELWRVHHGKGFSIVPRPVFNDDIVYFSTGFGKPELWAVQVTGEGEVTDTHVDWIVKRGIPAKPSPILSNGRIYVVEDSGVATCFDCEDGQQLWKQRLGGAHSASPLLAGENLYFANHDGQVRVVRASDQYQLVALNELGEKIMASPAVVNDALVIRTDQALYRFNP